MPRTNRLDGTRLVRAHRLLRDDWIVYFSVPARVTGTTKQTPPWVQVHLVDAAGERYGPWYDDDATVERIADKPRWGIE